MIGLHCTEAIKELAEETFLDYMAWVRYHSTHQHHDASVSDAADSIVRGFLLKFYDVLDREDRQQAAMQQEADYARRN